MAAVRFGTIVEEHPPGRPRGRQPFALSCIVPVANEGASIHRFLRHLGTAALALTPKFEIVVVNDGSDDDSRDEILRAARDLPIHYLELSRNFGKEIALQAGLDVVKGDCTVILDADFQHPVELIAQMVDRWQAGADMVYGVQTRAGESRLRKAGCALFYKLLAPQRGLQVPANAGDFRLLDRRVVSALRQLPERARFMKGLYAWVGFRAEGLEFTAAPRHGGVSKFGTLRLASLAITGITAFSSVPLRVLSVTGFVVSSLAAVMGCWLVIEKLLFHQPIPGFTTLAASIFFLSGIQLLGLGVVGEYVGRIFDEVKGRPLYVIADEHRSVAYQRLAGNGAR